MKVVINKCFGGFGLSDAALKELYKRGSKIIEAHEPKEYYGGREGWEKDFERDKKQTSFMQLVVVDNKIITRKWGDEHRTDKDLIAIVEKMGTKANGRHAELKVVEIPDDIEWEIGEYDGTEWIDEKHRSWG